MIKLNSLKKVFAEIDDISRLTEYRMKLWDDAGKFTTKEEFDDLYLKNFNFFKKLFEQKKIIAPMFIDSSKNIVSVGIGIVIQKPPVNWDNMGEEGYIFNMYTEENFRGQGLATDILNEILSFFKEQKISKLSLTSNSKSRTLYEKNGLKSNIYYQELSI